MNYIWLIPLLPGIGAAVNGLVGIRSFSKKTAGAVAVGTMTAALVISVVAFFQLLGLPAESRAHEVILASLADDARWVVTGQYSWSRTFTGKEAILNDLHGHVRSLLVERARTIANRFIADGDCVVVEARGDNVTKTGIRYDNDYCLVFRLENGKIKEVREYCDSVLTEQALGRFPEPRRRAAV